MPTTRKSKTRKQSGVETTDIEGKKAKYIVLIARVSPRKKQGAKQLPLLRDYCHTMGWKIVQEFATRNTPENLSISLPHAVNMLLKPGECGIGNIFE